MDLQVPIGFAVVLFAVASFFFLAHTLLWSTWEMKGGMADAAKTSMKATR